MLIVRYQLLMYIESVASRKTLPIKYDRLVTYHCLLAIDRYQCVITENFDHFLRIGISVKCLLLNTNNNFMRFIIVSSASRTKHTTASWMLERTWQRMNSWSVCCLDPLRILNTSKSSTISRYLIWSMLLISSVFSSFKALTIRTRHIVTGWQQMTHAVKINNRTCEDPVWSISKATLEFGIWPYKCVLQMNDVTSWQTSDLCHLIVVISEPYHISLPGCTWLSQSSVMHFHLLYDKFSVQGIFSIKVDFCCSNAHHSWQQSNFMSTSKFDFRHCNFWIILIWLVVCHHLIFELVVCHPWFDWLFVTASDFWISWFDWLFVIWFLNILIWLVVHHLIFEYLDLIGCSSCQVLNLFEEFELPHLVVQLSKLAVELAEDDDPNIVCYNYICGIIQSPSIFLEN